MMDNNGFTLSKLKGFKNPRMQLTNKKKATHAEDHGEFPIEKKIENINDN